jgi:uncharacterized protein (TIGR03032 family)
MASARSSTTTSDDGGPQPLDRKAGDVCAAAPPDRFVNEREDAMSALTVPTLRNGPGEAKAGTPPAPPAPVAFHYTQSESFSAVLAEMGSSLLISTYQANKLLVARAVGAGAGVSMLVRTFDRPMGLAINGGQLALGCRDQVWLFRDAPDIAPQVEPVGQHDACFLPRSSHVTGDIGIHEIAWVGGELWAVNTRFSCLCTLHPAYSFVPQWRPPFITALAAEDRCHLNGLALVDGQPKYVTALGESDSAGGWRADKPRGGWCSSTPPPANERR